jgi:hypothetical protein
MADGGWRMADGGWRMAMIEFAGYPGALHAQDLVDLRFEQLRACGDAPLAEGRAWISGGEQWPQPLLQRSARKRADDSVDLLTVPDHDEQRDRLRAKPRGESSIRVDVDLYDLEVPRVAPGQVLEHG